MENKEPMFICRRDPNGRHTVMEATPRVLDVFVTATAKKGSQASSDAVLMALGNGSEVSDGAGGTWYRIESPVRLPMVPDRCALTNRPIQDVVYDARTRYGGWCAMSQAGWEQHGVGELGTGDGQKYMKGTDETFYLAEGITTSPIAYGRAA